MFVFESGNPPVLVVYQDLDDASGLLESLDIGALDEAFLQVGQPVT